MIVIKKNEHDVNDYNFQKNYIELKELSEDFMQDIIYTLSDTYTTMDTETCLETLDYIYQFCYIEVPSDHIKKEIEVNMNRLATYISPEHKIITGTACLLKFTNNEKMNIVPIKIDDLELLLERKKTHEGLIVKTDGTLIPFKFANADYASILLELEPYVRKYFYLEEEGPKMVCAEKNICAYHLEVYVYVSNVTSKLSDSMTKIYGKKVYGDSIVVLKITDKLYGNITPDEFKNLLLVYDKEQIKLEKEEFNNRFLMLNRVIKNANKI